MSASSSLSSASSPELPMKAWYHSPSAVWAEKAQKAFPVAQRKYSPQQGEHQLPCCVEPPRVS
eukprot:10772056-Lingulodinium_polyedra.AAC.1